MPTKKKSAESEGIALSEFARRVSCTSKTIERYIAAGKIYGPAVVLSPGGKNKLIFELAHPQYLAAVEITAHRFARAANSGGDYAEKITPKPALVGKGLNDMKARKRGQGKTPKLNDSQAQEMDNLLALGSLSPFDQREKLEAYLAGAYPLPAGPVLDMALAEHGLSRPAGGVEVIPADRRAQPHGGNLKSGKDKLDADITGASSSDMSEDELQRLNITDLTKREAVLRVIAKQIEIGKTSGQLIDISKVDAALFSFGVEIRKRFESIPHRIIDSLRNAKNRAEALNIFNKELNDCLSALANASEVIETIKSNRGK